MDSNIGSDPQKQTNSNQKQTKTKIIFLSLFYFLVTITYSSFSTVMVYLHQKYKHKGYGQSYLTANIVASVSMYLFSPFLIHKLRNKSKMLLISCAFGYFLNVFIPVLCLVFQNMPNESHQNNPPSNGRFILQIIANLIGGAASGLFWVLQGIYMANFCREYPENAKGRFFSIANDILNFRLILAPLLIIFGLGLGSQIAYFFLLSLIVLSSLPLAVFRIPSINLQQTFNKPLANSTSNNLDEIDQNKNKNIFKYLCQFLQFFAKVKLILPICILAGLSTGFVSSSLSHLLPKPAPGQTNDNNIAIALIFFGLGNVLGGHLSGLFSDRYSIINAGYIGNFFIITGAIVQAICLRITPAVSLSCFVGFLEGLSYSYLFSLASIICTVYYHGNSTSFATTRQTTSFSYIIYQWVVAFLNNNCNMKLNMTYQGLALIPIALFACWCLKKQGEKRQSQKNVQTSITEMKKCGENTSEQNTSPNINLQQK